MGTLKNMKNLRRYFYSIIQYPLRQSISHSKLIVTLLIISQLTIVSCQSLIKEIDPSILPQTDSKLVVACFISPQDTVLSAKVTETKVLIGSTGDIKDDITNATVKLSTGSKTITLVYNAADGYYRALHSELLIVPGKTYNIEVSTPDGRKVSASTTVPTNVSIKEVKIDSTQTIDVRRGTTATNTEYTVKVIWQDKAGETNFYRGISVFDVFYQVPDSINPKKINTKFLSSMIDLRTIDDKGSDGELISLSRTYQPINFGVNFQGNQANLSNRLDKIKVGLFQTDPSYYNYHTALRKQRENNNPFAEPVLLYTNIKGGFGCFGAYNATWQEIKTK